MTSYEKIYWLTRMDDIKHYMQVIPIFMIAFTVVIYVGCAAYGDFCDDDEELKKTRKRWKFKLNFIVPIGIILGIAQIFVPTTKEMLVIIAGGKTIDYVQADTSLQKLPSQTTAIISQFFDNQLNELKKDKSDKK